MYKEHGIQTTDPAKQGEPAADLKSVRAFVKIARMPGSVESVLAAASASSLQVVELSLRSSLDKAFHFVHLSLEGSGDFAQFGDSLCRLPGVKCAEVGRAG